MAAAMGGGGGADVGPGGGGAENGVLMTSVDRSRLLKQVDFCWNAFVDIMETASYKYNQAQKIVKSMSCQKNLP